MNFTMNRGICFHNKNRFNIHITNFHNKSKVSDMNNNIYNHVKLFTKLHWVMSVKNIKVTIGIIKNKKKGNEKYEY